VDWLDGIDEYLCEVYRTDFPNLTWLKKQIDRGFENNQLQGWPNVVINARTTSEHRPDIKGTLSLFSNIKGESVASAEHYKVQIPEDYFFISNNKQEYSLDIETNKPIETFNIHFSESLLQDMSNALQKNHTALLDDTSTGQPALSFYNKLYRKDETFNRIVFTIRHKAATQELSDMELEELLTDLLLHLIEQNTDIGKQVNTLDAEKLSTREELYRRLIRATDYMAAHYARTVSLDELAGIACLSKFHFMRMFKAVFRQSPYQYITSLRMQEAGKLLRFSSFEIQHIAAIVGYDNNSSFSRVFLKQMKRTPLEYRSEQ
jgi:AraC family transcriptional regulator